MQKNIDQIEERICAAANRAGRDRSEITLIAVSKTYGPERVREAIDCGLSLFGENRVQEAQKKAPLCPRNANWHLIGHLQKNKAKFVPNLFSMMHSVDSVELAQALDKHATRPFPILLQVNITGEAAKSGFAPIEVAEAINAINQLKKVEVHGLMLIPPFVIDKEESRPHFRALRELRNQLQIETGSPLPELSMGMSGDFEIAIEEGSTFVRVGSALFGARN